MLPNTGSTIRVIFAADVVLFFGTRWKIIHHIGERERESEVLARNSYIPHCILASGNYGQSNKSREKKINPGVRYQSQLCGSGSAQIRIMGDLLDPETGGKKRRIPV